MQELTIIAIMSHPVWKKKIEILVKKKIKIQTLQFVFLATLILFKINSISTNAINYYKLDQKTFLYW